MFFRHTLRETDDSGMRSLTSDEMRVRCERFLNEIRNKLCTMERLPGMALEQTLDKFQHQVGLLMCYN